MVHELPPGATRSTWNNEHVAGSKRDRGPVLQLDPEAALPPQKELVLIVMVPGKLAVEPRQPDDRVIDVDQIRRLPGLEDCLGGSGDRNGLFSRTN
jgi:hypothetical protein